MTWRRHSGHSSKKSTPWWASDTSPGIGTWPLPISPASEMVWWGARNGRVVTNAVRAPVRPATLWIRVVSMASARVIAGRMVVSRRASIDLPAPGGPSKRTLWAERLHNLYLRFCTAEHRYVGAQDCTVGSAGSKNVKTIIYAMDLRCRRCCGGEQRQPISPRHRSTERALSEGLRLRVEGDTLPTRRGHRVGVQSADKVVTAGPCPPPSAGKISPRPTGTAADGTGPAGRT